MSSACTHVPSGAPEPVCRVGCTRDGVDPVLVVTSSHCRDADAVTEDRFVEITGDLDTHTAALIESRLAAIAEQCPRIVLDVGGVSFVDGAGLRLLEQIHDRVTANGGRVRLHDPSRQILRLIDIVRSERFDVCEPIADRHSVRTVELAGGREHPSRR